MTVSKRSLRGFSLVEVMISGTLFLLTLTGVTTSTKMLVDFQQHAKQMTIATHLAEFSIEELLLRFDADPDLDPALNPHSRQFDKSGEPVTLGGLYTATWNVSPVPNVTTLKMVNLVLSWTENGNPKTITLITYRP